MFREETDEEAEWPRLGGAKKLGIAGAGELGTPETLVVEGDGDGGAFGGTTPGIDGGLEGGADGIGGAACGGGGGGGGGADDGVFKEAEEENDGAAFNADAADGTGCVLEGA